MAEYLERKADDLDQRAAKDQNEPTLFSDWIGLRQVDSRTVGK